MRREPPAAPAITLWSFLTSSKGLALWLGPSARVPLEKGAAWSSRTAHGEVRSARPLDRVRVTYAEPSWDAPATFQLAVRGDDDRTLLRFHAEHLRDREQRTELGARFAQALDAIERAVVGASPAKTASARRVSRAVGTKARAQSRER